VSRFDNALSIQGFRASAGVDAGSGPSTRRSKGRTRPAQDHRQHEGDIMVSREFRLQLKGYGLTTAEIHYRLPDHPALLQRYLWQDYDLAPNFPTLQGFLDFWQRELEGALHSVRVAHQRLIKPSEWRAVNGIISVH
jgi:uncharacterized protein Usg